MGVSLYLSPPIETYSSPPFPAPPPPLRSISSLFICVQTHTHNILALSLSLSTSLGVCTHTINEAYIFTSSSYSSPSSHPSDSGTLHTHPPYSGHFRALYAESPTLPQFPHTWIRLHYTNNSVDVDVCSPGPRGHDGY